MKTRTKYFWISLPILLLLAGSVVAGPKGDPKDSHKLVTECGTVLTEKGHYKLGNDLLDCPTDGVIINGSHISLDLKKHEISCLDNSLEIRGVVVEGTELAPVSKVSVKNGLVSNCVEGVMLKYAEKSKVTKITAKGNGNGIAVRLSSKVAIHKNRTFGNENDGIIVLFGSDNLVKQNKSYDNVNAFGIYLEDEINSEVVRNLVHGNMDGISLGPLSSGNLIKDNFVSNNLYSGIGMMGFLWDGYLWGPMPAGNIIRSNTVEDHDFFDVYELLWDWVTGELLIQPDGICLNTWEHNQYETTFGPVGCFGVPGL